MERALNAKLGHLIINFRVGSLQRFESSLNEIVLCCYVFPF